jgi:hypothetical protein
MNDKPHRMSLGDILKLIHDENRVGVLNIEGESVKIEFHIEEGKIVGISGKLIERDYLVNKLLKMGILSDRHVRKIFNRMDREDISFEKALLTTRLAHSGLIEKIMDSESKESLYKIFLMTGLNCTFKYVTPCREGIISTLPIPIILKEIRRRAKEWPLIQTRVRSPAAIFEKCESFPSSSEERGDVAWEDLPLDGNERIAFFFVDGNKAVEEISVIGGLSEYETMRAIYGLLEKGFIKPVSFESIVGDFKSRRKKIFERIFNVIFYVLLILLFTGVFLGSQNIYDSLSGSINLNDDPAINEFQKCGKTYLKAVITGYYMEKGSLPRSLQEMVEKGFITASDPDLRRFEYERKENKYILTYSGGKKSGE